MASGKTPLCFLDETTQRNMKEPCYSEAPTDMLSFKNAQWESNGMLCDACLPHRERLRLKFEGFKEENNRLMSQLHSVFGWMRLAEMVVLSPDEAIAVAGCLSLCSSTDRFHTTAAEKDSLLPE
eukprot:c38027_g1_i1 orf=3-371(-)